MKVGDEVWVRVHCDDCTLPGALVQHRLRARVIYKSTFLDAGMTTACELRLTQTPECASVRRQSPRNVTFADAQHLEPVDAVTRLGELA